MSTPLTGRPTVRPTSQVSGDAGGTQRVRVWFGAHVVTEYVAAPERAAQYAEAVGRRFAGLRVTVDDVPAAHVAGGGPSPAALPAERLWELTP